MSRLSCGSTRLMERLIVDLADEVIPNSPSCSALTQEPARAGARGALYDE